MEESLLNSLQTKLKYRQDLENGDIWSATDIYHSKIYLGNGYDACNYQELMNKKISHILNCTNDVPNYFEDDDNLSISYLKLDVLDFGVDQGISRVFPEAIRFIQDVVNDKDNGNCILIHCANGSNRSVTIAIAVLMVLNDWNLSQSWNHVCSLRSQAAPLRDNRLELLKFEASIYHKNSMFESNARLIDFPTNSPSLKDIRISLATGSLEEAAQCLEIYTPIVYDTTITFEIIPPTPEEFATRMTKTMEKYPWLLAYDLATKRVVGYAYAGIFKDRAAYRSVPPPLLCLGLTIKGPCRRWSVESSIYISSSYPRRGIATKLYDALFTLLRVMNIINVIAVIALPNDKSVQLHEKYSFRTVGVFSKIGYKHESWIDVVYMEKSLQEPRYLSLENPEKIYANKAGEGEEEGEEREMMEPVFYPDCAHQLAEVLRAMEFSQSSS